MKRAFPESKLSCIEVLEGKVIKMGPQSVIISTSDFLYVNLCERLMTTLSVLVLFG